MHMTVTEVQRRVAQFEATEAPKLQATIEAMCEHAFREFLLVVKTYCVEQELQQQRMTDDGCPLAGSS